MGEVSCCRVSAVERSYVGREILISLRRRAVQNILLVGIIRTYHSGARIFSQNTPQWYPVRGQRARFGVGGMGRHQPHRSWEERYLASEDWSVVPTASRMPIQANARRCSAPLCGCHPPFPFRSFNPRRWVATLRKDSYKGQESFIPRSGCGAGPKRPTKKPCWRRRCFRLDKVDVHIAVRKT